jgi:hypothetical protein
MRSNRIDLNPQDERRPGTRSNHPWIEGAAARASDCIASEAMTRLERNACYPCLTGSGSRMSSSCLVAAGERDGRLASILSRN